ncbi:unnamed protein product [Rangifer tarandus platyrhynchus]|uniref:Translation initiation factor IF-2-like n=1 Tax=Rangifer tarandus platyrhynchus TaxID=3082113 RepID=A0ABN9A1C1_RANTA|nr:unnamed protein product [Rangifer tarandus platyrhynchus]
MSPLSAARAALRVYAVGAALIVAQLLRRCVRGFVEPGQRPGRRRGAGAARAGRSCWGLAGDRAAGPGARPPPLEGTPRFGAELGMGAGRRARRALPEAGPGGLGGGRRRALSSAPPAPRVPGAGVARGSRAPWPGVGVGSQVRARRVGRSRKPGPAAWRVGLRGRLSLPSVAGAGVSAGDPCAPQPRREPPQGSLRSADPHPGGRRGAPEIPAPRRLQ